MSVTYYKAVRCDGTDFFTGTVRWLPKDGPPKRKRVVRHPSSTQAIKGEHSTSLAVSTDPTRLPGASWPMRLCVVEPVDGAPVVETDVYKRQSVAWRVVEEVSAHLRFGPQGVHVVALVEAIMAMTPEQVRTATAAASGVAWAAARGVATVAAWAAARDAATVATSATTVAATVAAWAAARDAATVADWDPASDAACAAAWALVVRDLIPVERYDALTRPVRLAGITVHPDDPEIQS